MFHRNESFHQNLRLFYKIFLGRDRKKNKSGKIELKNMMYLVWESSRWLSVHEADTLPTELTRFLFVSAKSGLNRRPSELQSDALPTELLAEPIECKYRNMN